MEDKKKSESFHGPDDNPKHREGSYFTPEITWLQDLYDTYSPAITLVEYGADESRYFTHTQRWDGPYDRKLDYLFTNTEWIAGSDSTYHVASAWSDHAAISARWGVPK